jgi:hypothetical protein
VQCATLDQEAVASFGEACLAGNKECEQGPRGFKMQPHDAEGRCYSIKWRDVEANLKVRRLHAARIEHKAMN